MRSLLLCVFVVLAARQGSASCGVDELTTSEAVPANSTSSIPTSSTTSDSSGSDTTASSTQNSSTDATETPSTTSESSMTSTTETNSTRSTSSEASLKTTTSSTPDEVSTSSSTSPPSPSASGQLSFSTRECEGCSSVSTESSSTLSSTTSSSSSTHSASVSTSTTETSTSSKPSSTTSASTSISSSTSSVPSSSSTPSSTASHSSSTVTSSSPEPVSSTSTSSSIGTSEGTSEMGGPSSSTTSATSTAPPSSTSTAKSSSSSESSTASSTTASSSSTQSTTTTATSSEPSTSSSSTSSSPSTVQSTTPLVCDNGYPLDKCDSSCGCPVYTLNGVEATEIDPNVTEVFQTAYKPQLVWEDCKPTPQQCSGGSLAINLQLTGNSLDQTTVLEWNAIPNVCQDNNKWSNTGDGSLYWTCDYYGTTSSTDDVVADSSTSSGKEAVRLTDSTQNCTDYSLEQCPTACGCLDLSIDDEWLADRNLKSSYYPPGSVRPIFTWHNCTAPVPNTCPSGYAAHTVRVLNNSDTVDDRNTYERVGELQYECNESTREWQFLGDPSNSSIVGFYWTCYLANNLGR